MGKARVGLERSERVDARFDLFGRPLPSVFMSAPRSTSLNVLSALSQSACSTVAALRTSAARSDSLVSESRLTSSARTGHLVSRQRASAALKDRPPLLTSARFFAGTSTVFAATAFLAACFFVAAFFFAVGVPLVTCCKSARSSSMSVLGVCSDMPTLPGAVLTPLPLVNFNASTIVDREENGTTFLSAAQWSVEKRGARKTPTRNGSSFLHGDEVKVAARFEWREAFVLAPVLVDLEQLTRCDFLPCSFSKTALLTIAMTLAICSSLVFRSDFFDSILARRRRRFRRLQVRMCATTPR